MIFTKNVVGRLGWAGSCYNDTFAHTLLILFTRT